MQNRSTELHHLTSPLQYVRLIVWKFGYHHHRCIFTPQTLNKEIWTYQLSLVGLVAFFNQQEFVFPFGCKEPRPRCRLVNPCMTSSYGSLQMILIKRLQVMLRRKYLHTPWVLKSDTLPKLNVALKSYLRNKKVVFQTSFFRNYVELRGCRMAFENSMLPISSKISDPKLIWKISPKITTISCRFEERAWLDFFALHDWLGAERRRIGTFRRNNKNMNVHPKTTVLIYFHVVSYTAWVW